MERKNHAELPLQAGTAQQADPSEQRSHATVFAVSVMTSSQSSSVSLVKRSSKQQRPKFEAWEDLIWDVQISAVMQKGPEKLDLPI